MVKRERIHFMPTKNSDINYEEIEDETTHDWRRKAEALQARRWRAIKREMKGGR